MVIAKRFLMKYYPEFFSMRKDDQDSFKIQHEKEINEKFCVFFYESLMNKNITYEEFDRSELSNEMLFKFNKETTFLRGVGNNYFYLNEHFAEDQTMLSFSTLYDYDYDNHVFQEKIMMEHDKTKKDIPPYRLRLNYNWARAYLDNKFIYITLANPSIYIYDHVKDACLNFIDTLIPNELIEMENHGKETEDGNYIWDMDYVANGKEILLDNLRNFVYQSTSKLLDELIIFFDENKQHTAWKIPNNSNATDPQVLYLISDNELAANIRFKHFEKDIKSYETTDLSLIHMIINEKTREYQNKTQKEYDQQIMNYSPNIKKFPNKKPKVFIDPSAFD